MWDDQQNPYKFEGSEEEEGDEFEEEHHPNIFDDAICYFIPLYLLVVSPSIPVLFHKLFGWDNYLLMLFVWVTIVWPLAIRNIVFYFRNLA